MSIIIGKIIRELRAKKNISQETLAEKMGVTVQAVSKWENEQSCPDISLIPELGEFFGVTADFLLTGKNPQPDSYEYAEGLPDDGKLRIVQARGRKILGQGEFDGSMVIKLKLPPVSEQPNIELDVWSGCSIEGDVNGNVQCGDGVCCGNVGGNVTTGDGACCRNVGGNVTAGDGVSCSEIKGDVHCEVIFKS